MWTFEQARCWAENDDALVAIDRVFADFILKLTAGESVELYLASLLASFAVRQGHSCADLKAWSEKEGFPPFAAWLAALAAPENRIAVTLYDGGGTPATPLVADRAGRCYLQRYFVFEKTVAKRLIELAAQPVTPPELAPGRLHQLSQFFPDAAAHPAPDYQQWAVWNGVSRALTVLSGGPGTGKTTVAAALIALELELHPGLRIALAAPTGKAQARLVESLRNNLGRLRVSDAVRERMAALEAGTIHKLLGARRNSNEFRHHAGNPLPCDLLIVDECSMVPLNLMARLLAALRPGARLVLLGDRRQLASVEAGAVMADICDAGAGNVGTAAQVRGFAAQTRWKIPEISDAKPLSGCVVELTENHRFDRDAPLIGRIATAIREVGEGPDAAAALAAQMTVWQGAEYAFFRSGGVELERHLAAAVRKIRIDGRWRLLDLPELATKGTPEARAIAFRLLDSFRILAPQLRGRRGVYRLNELIMEQLNLTSMEAPGMAILILTNDPRTGLFNGDTGLAALDRPGGAVRIFFPGIERGFLPGELPAHEAVFAMTVHKSQGSGFSEVMVVMPETDSPLLTRELVYTAATRAEKRLEIWSDERLLARALAAPTHRDSGLLHRLEEMASPC